MNHPTVPGADLDAVVHRRLLDAGSVPASATERRSVLAGALRDEAPLLAPDERDAALTRLEARIAGLGPLDPLLADATVSEVMVNGTGDVWVERHGRLAPTPLVLPPGQVHALIERVVGPLGLHVDRSRPMVDARLPDGSRVNAVVPPLAVDGPCLTIRRFGARRIDLADVATPGVARLLRWAVAARANLVVCGGAGAGKTTLLNALAAGIPPTERVVTVEDTAELRLDHPHVVRLEARPANAEGVGEVRIRDLVRNALRMRPDRIIVGETRGGEAVDMVQAMLTGHEGSLSTCHANRAGAALRRLETLVLTGDVGLPMVAVREQLAAAIDLVVHVGRQADGARRVLGVAEVDEAPAPDGTLGARSLVGPPGLTALPTRAVRRPDSPPPSPSWLEGP
jgi:pilus assembly protein CpaF